MGCTFDKPVFDKVANSPVNWSCRICWLHLWRGTRLLQQVSWVWQWTESDGEASVLEIWGMWSTPSFLLLPGPLWARMVVPTRIPFMGQLELFNHLNVYKQMTDVELLMLHSNTWNHLCSNEWVMLNRINNFK